MKRLAVAALLCLVAAAAAQSSWIRVGVHGTLQYTQTPRGDRIVDFSYAGYRGGGVAIPDWPATITLEPAGADDTAAIQAAIDQVSQRPLSASGHRGTVSLSSGHFHCAKTLTIRASGVVLRGAGPVSARSGTTIELTGEPHLGIDVTGEFHERVLTGDTTITDAYVPSGAMLVHVADASAIHAGDTLLIVKPVTPSWVKFMHMDRLVRDGKPQTWVGEDLKAYRRVAKVEGNAITLDVPLTDDIDAKYLDGKQAPVSRVEITGTISEVGIEDLSLVAAARSIAYREDAEFDGIGMDNAVDSWMSNLHFEDTTNSVRLEKGVERVTIKDVSVDEQKSVTSSAKNFEFSVNGTQVLLDRCTGNGNGLFYFATQSRQQGPVVILHCKFLGDGRIEPHQRWSTGLLVDSCDVPGGGISLQNRGTMGSGHGWTIGWSVLWNNQAASILVQEPPGAANWSIGDRGQQVSLPMPTSGGPKGGDLPQGIVESPGKPVSPPSLYLEQLRERLGEAAVKAIGD
jgi:hypothetical protein